MNLEELAIRFQSIKDELMIVRDIYKEKLDIHRGMSKFEKGLRVFSYRKKEEKIIRTINNTIIFEKRINDTINKFNVLFEYYDASCKYEYLEEKFKDLSDEILKVDRWYENDLIPYWVSKELEDMDINIEVSITNAINKIRKKEKEEKQKNNYYGFNSNTNYDYAFNGSTNYDQNHKRSDFKGYANNKNSSNNGKRKMPANIVKALLNIEMPKGSDVNRTIVKQQYKNVAKKYHPDVNPNGEEKMKIINSSYEELLAYFK